MNLLSLILILLPVQVIAQTLMPVRDNTDEIINRLIACESSGKPLAVNKDESHGISAGILQFRRETFIEQFKKYKLADTTGWEEADFDNAWWDSTLQRKLAKLMLNDGMGKRWSCYSKIWNQKEIK